jgi:plastocyanin domain-containing protein
MTYKTIMIAVFAILISVSGTEVYAQRTSKLQKRTAQKVQNVRINLTESGYQPASFRLKKGVPARVTFIRKTESECGKEIVIPAYNIRRELPLNQPVTVSFTPKKAGSFGFACGMNMMRGKVIVR